MLNPMKALDYHVAQALKAYGLKLETHFEADVLSYVGTIHPALVPHFLESIESLQESSTKDTQKYPKRLVIVLITGGGVVEAVEKMVAIIRYYYEEVFFIVPDAAMSAGTIWCMSGDKIYMDYASSLGPIDPQVPTHDGKLVPALGYIDKVNEFIEKSKTEELSKAEYFLLKSLDLGVLRRHEQARNLSISLLEEWLIKYKFKDWNTHRTNDPGTLVTLEEKRRRAKEIAGNLSNNNMWHSHGRMIGMQTLRTILRLEIEDYSTEKDLRDNIRMYSGLLADYLEKRQLPVMIHNARM